jgi:hypothetical protein
MDNFSSKKIFIKKAQKYHETITRIQLKTKWL